jgi:hypothetical protein
MGADGCAEEKSIPEGSRVTEGLNRVFGAELTSDEGTVEADAEATAMSTADVDETGGGGGVVPVNVAEISSFRLKHEALVLHEKRRRGRITSMLNAPL